MSAETIDEKLARVSAATRAKPATLPTLASVAERVTRIELCACGGTFSQILFAGVFTPSKCEACLERENEAKLAEEAAQREQDRRAKALESLDVPLLYKNATLDTFELIGEEPERQKQREVVRLARRYLGTWPDRQSDELRFPQVVIFTGGPGTGKGHVAWSIARAVAVDYGDSVKFTVLSDCVRDLREAWRSSDGPSEAKRLAAYRSPDLLIVDEVSSHAFRGEPTQHLYDLVAWREQRLLPTIITTNEETKALASILGTALVSRAAGWSALWDFGSVDVRVARRKSRGVAA